MRVSYPDDVKRENAPQPAEEASSGNETEAKAN